MIRIEMSPNDQKDIIDLLDYALDMQYLTRHEKDSFYLYWKLRIPQLKVVLLGKNMTPPIYKSALGGIGGKKEEE